jgi:hypothetical protein
MSAFELLPRKWYSSDYRVLRGEVELTSFKFLSGPERSFFSLTGNSYLAHKEKWNSPNFFLDEGETRIALAKKPSWSSKTFHLEHQGRPYTLKAESKRFVLSCDQKEVGSIAKTGWFSRNGTADLPDDLPLSINLFLIWLALLMWKRESDDSSSAAIIAST